MSRMASSNSIGAQSRQRAALPAALNTLTRQVTTLFGEPALVLLLIIIGLAAQAINMFDMPAFTFNGDEGIYTGQALAVLHDGRLAPYTYWYDHAPGGWILLAAWMALSGGPHTFGGAIDSGRVLMLLLHLVMIQRLYRVARACGCGPAPAALATLLFSLSPLAIFYQRPVMLDTLMLFWALISLDLLLDGQGRLSRVAVSGFCFGVALLTKETAVFLLPAMLFIAVHERRRHHGRFAVIGWVLPMLMVTSWYLLYAALKGELLPATLSASLFGDTRPHVSLIETLLWQSKRDGGGMFNLDNQFWHFVRTDWMTRDPIVLVGGVAAVAINLLRGVWPFLVRLFVRRGQGPTTNDQRPTTSAEPSSFVLRPSSVEGQLLAIALLGLFPLYYLARGGLVFNFYIVFAIPFFCLNIATMLAPLCARIPAWASAAVVATIVGALVLTCWQAGTLQPLYTMHSSEAGRAAIVWIRQALPAQSVIVADDSFWPDLREPKPGERAFPNIHSHWKVGGDPEVREGIFHNDWRTVDYLIMTPGLAKTFAESNNSVALEALQHAHLVQHWVADGAEVELWQVDKPSAPVKADGLGEGCALWA
jgi:4-amino-4-deoxy-L-arabinose transferase-like glycosyltransferase